MAPRLEFRSRLQVGLLVLAFAGYPLAALVPTLLQVDSRVASIPLRAFTLFGSLAHLASGRLGLGTSSRVRVPLLLFGGAWLAMMLRFVVDVGLLGVQPSINFVGGGEFLLFVLGAGLIPSLVLLRPLEKVHLRSANRLMAIAVAFVVLVSAWKFGAVESDLGPAIARAQSESLNAITYGSMGAILIILVLLYPFPRNAVRTRVALLAVSSAIGGWALISSASRGPILALGTVLVMVLVSRARNRKVAILNGVALVAILVAAYMVLPSLIARFSEDSTLASRLDGVEVDGSTLERLYLIQASWEIFTSNPLLGGAIAVPVLHAYPHNIILEGLMVGGIGLGVIMTLITGYCVRAAFRLIRENGSRSFLGGLILFHTVMAMTSGSLYIGPEIWFSLALAIASA